MATLSIQVSQVTKDDIEAKKELDARVAHYFDFLGENGIDKKDIHAANIETHAEYDYPKDQEKRFKGYRASRHIRVTVR